MVKKIFFALFCYIEGLGLGYLINIYSQDLFLKAICVTTIVVLLSMIIGYNCRNLSFLGNILFYSLLICIVYMLLGLFFSLPSISLVVVFIFVGFVAYDINMFKRKLVETNGVLKTDEILDEVMNMYLDIINLFINILDLLES